MTCPRPDDLTELLGPAALGLLTTAEQADLDVHLRTCADCRRELADLTATAQGLGALDAQSALAGGALADGVLTAVARERRRATRLQAVVAAAAGVAVLLAGLVTAGAMDPAPEVPFEAVAVQAGAGVEARADLVAHTWGVEIKLVAAGLADGKAFTVQVRTEGGELVDAGAFLGTGDRTLTCNLNASVLREDAASFTVRDSGGREVLSAEL